MPALLARNAELLLALEHLATQALRLEPEEHEPISFDAAHFKAERTQRLRQDAATAVREVRHSGPSLRVSADEFARKPSSASRARFLRLTYGILRTASEGEGAGRHLVLHPERP